MATNLQSLGPLVSMRRNDSSAVPSSNGTPTSSAATNADAINTEAQKSGLEVRKSRARNDASTEVSSGEAQPVDASETPAPQQATEEAGSDQEALKALLAGHGIGGDSDPGAPLIIPQELETEMLQNDIDSRPEAPTLDDYAATPIDQFGMALLRGMGWKEGAGAGKGGRGPQQAAEPKKRAALLGLGAKERPVGASGLPTASSSSASRKPRTDRRDYKYVPVMKAESSSATHGQALRSDDRLREDRPREQHSTRHSDRREREERHSSSRSSHRQRSKSPTRSRDDDRDRHRDRRSSDDRESERRSHGSSRSDRERDRRSDRDRDERRRDHRR